MLDHNDYCAGDRGMAGLGQRGLEAGGGLGLLGGAAGGGEDAERSHRQRNVRQTRLHAHFTYF